jgi:peptidoglycan/xylan/chitin deacetylase (PgdA/CDA1 family)
MNWRPAPAIWAAGAVHAGALVAGVATGAWPWAFGAMALSHGALGAAGMVPRSQILGPVLTRLPMADWVGLSFDDGPDPVVTPAVLDALAAAGCRGSFFCIAARAARHPRLVREIVARGHRVENHSATHPSHFACLGWGGLRREVGEAQARLADLAGVAPRLFRPPMGLRNPLLDPFLAQAGLCHAAWTRRGFDTRRGDPARVLRCLTRNLGGGDILLLHDGNAARTTAGVPVVQAVLPALLSAIAALGLRGVAIALPGGQLSHDKIA